MGLPDNDAKAALSEAVIRPVWLGWLDVLGQPVRVTTAPYPVTFIGTGDPDLDGQTFGALDPGQIISVSEVNNKEGGADTVTCTLSGLISVDSAFMNLIGNRANWQGRVGRLWLMMYDSALQRVGLPWSYYTGYMMVPRILGDPGSEGKPGSQVITIEIESYLAALTQASGRTYLSQREYDSADTSADASIAIANGTSGAALSGTGGGWTQYDMIGRGGLMF